MTRAALRLRVRGVVQGVGFRPFVHRLAGRLGLAGWVFNDFDGVEIHIEGSPDTLEAFVRELAASPPPAADINTVDGRVVDPQGFVAFEIQGTEHGERPTAPISPDLPVCAACLAELSDSSALQHVRGSGPSPGADRQSGPGVPPRGAQPRPREVPVLRGQERWLPSVFADAATAQ